MKRKHIVAAKFHNGTIIMKKHLLDINKLRLVDEVFSNNAQLIIGYSLIEEDLIIIIKDGVNEVIIDTEHPDKSSFIFLLRGLLSSQRWIKPVLMDMAEKQIEYDELIAKGNMISHHGFPWSTLIKRKFHNDLLDIKESIEAIIHIEQISVEKTYGKGE